MLERFLAAINKRFLVSLHACSRKGIRVRVQLHPLIKQRIFTFVTKQTNPSQNNSPSTNVHAVHACLEETVYIHTNMIDEYISICIAMYKTTDTITRPLEGHPELKEEVSRLTHGHEAGESASSTDASVDRTKLTTDVMNRARAQADLWMEEQLHPHAQKESSSR
jgi:hypothetical protein